MSAQTQSGFKFSDWYEKNKARLSEKRKKLYRENSEFRDSALRRAEVQRKRRQDNPEDTQGYTNGFSDTAEELGITVWTLREWRRKSYFPYLVDIASKGGNYLLNVGPDREGVIPAASQERLREIGKWMSVNSDSIYATSASPFKALRWGRCTQKPGKLYLHVFEWPKNGKLNVPMTNEIKKAYLLSAPEKTLACSATRQGAQIQLEGAAPDPIDSVVVAEIEGKAEPIPFVARQDRSGAVTLQDADADIIGKPVKMRGLGHGSNVFWIVPGDNYASWKARIAKPGKFTVQLDYACDAQMAGSEYTLAIGDQTLTGKVENTGGWETFKTVTLGLRGMDTRHIAGQHIAPAQVNEVPNSLFD
jgi:alpha-L-fucosidase